MDIELILILLKLVCLLVGVVYGFSNIVKAMMILKGGRVEITRFQLFAMAIGIVGFVSIQFKLYL